MRQKLNLRLRDVLDFEGGEPPQFSGNAIGKMGGWIRPRSDWGLHSGSS